MQKKNNISYSLLIDYLIVKATKQLKFSKDFNIV